jgi:uncharacterized protein YcbK (DUF882 family)
MHPRSLSLVLSMAALVPLLGMKPTGPGPWPPVPRASATDSVAVLAVHLGSYTFGLSGALRTRIAGPGAVVPLDLRWDRAPAGPVGYRWRPVMGTAGLGESGYLGEHDMVTAPRAPGIYELELGMGEEARAFGDALRVVVKMPFDAKRDGRIGPYFMGVWPTEGKGRRDAYAPPAGFIEVTEANQGLRLSENFTVGQFLTQDQGSVWPKYVAVDPRLIDKLELVLLELRAMGVRADRMVVMSGFRTPQYNHRHLGNSPSSLSRHQFGDAADVWVDNEGDWHMSDLNGDGRRDIGDARVILEAVERVERRYPELVGGAGLYRANRVRGPFIHIDVRGSRARW